MTLDLTNTTVVVTRPREQASQIQAALIQQGAQVWLCPTLEIAPPDYEEQATQVLQQLESFQSAIFISRNAVQYALHYLGSQQQKLKQLTLWAIGKQTALALEQAGFQAHSPEQGFTSEDLLALPEWQTLQKQRILLVRGQGGRKTLANTIAARGGVIEHAVVYQRTRPIHSAFDIKANWQHIDVVMITSVESLKNLQFLWRGTTGVYSIPLIVGSQRIAHYAQEAGFQTVFVADNPSDAAMLEALLYWKREHQL